MIDLRRIIGAFFVLVGVLLLTVPHAQAPLTTGPVNLYMAAITITFGVVMLVLGLRAPRSK
jgi:hypothetical protein